MAKQTFTSGQVLTAAQMTSLQSNDYNWTVSAKTANYVLVAADAGTTITMSSATATTITVNTSLFTAGDTLRIQNIGAAACVVTAGTATVSTAGSLSIPQWGGGTLYFTSAGVAVYFPNAGGSSGLVRVGGGALSGAATAFTSVFSATYAAYDIVITNLVSSGIGVGITLKMGATATGYYNSGLATTPGGSTLVYLGASNAANWEVTVGDSGSANGCRIHVSNPFLSAYTIQESSRINPITTGNMGRQQGLLANTTSYTDCTIGVSSGTITGTVNIYGYALS